MNRINNTLREKGKGSWLVSHVEKSDPIGGFVMHFSNAVLSVSQSGMGFFRSLNLSERKELFDSLKAYRENVYGSANFMLEKTAETGFLGAGGMGSVRSLGKTGVGSSIAIKESSRNGAGAFENQPGLQKLINEADFPSSIRLVDHYAVLNLKETRWKTHGRGRTESVFHYILMEKIGNGANLQGLKDFGEGAEDYWIVPNQKKSLLFFADKLLEAGIISSIAELKKFVDDSFQFIHESFTKVGETPYDLHPRNIVPIIENEQVVFYIVDY